MLHSRIILGSPIHDDAPVICLPYLTFVPCLLIYLFFYFQWSNFLKETMNGIVQDEPAIVSNYMFLYERTFPEVF